MSRDIWLAHHGIVGMKWGVRKDKRNTLQKKKHGGKLDLDLQFFANKRAKDRKFKFRTKQEEARVHNAIYQLSRKDRERDSFAIDVEVSDNKNKGAYTYYVKNNDGVHEVYGRTKIKDSSTGILERKRNNE